MARLKRGPVTLPAVPAEVVALTDRSGRFYYGGYSSEEQRQNELFQDFHRLRELRRVWLEEAGLWGKRGALDAWRAAVIAAHRE